MPQQLQEPLNTDVLGRRSKAKGLLYGNAYPNCYSSLLTRWLAQPYPSPFCHVLGQVVRELPPPGVPSSPNDPGAVLWGFVPFLSPWGRGRQLRPRSPGAGAVLWRSRGRAVRGRAALQRRAESLRNAAL